MLALPYISVMPSPIPSCALHLRIISLQFIFHGIMTYVWDYIHTTYSNVPCTRLKKIYRAIFFLSVVEHHGGSIIMRHTMSQRGLCMLHKTLSHYYLDLIWYVHIFVYVVKKNQKKKKSKKTKAKWVLFIFINFFHNFFVSLVLERERERV